MERPALKADAFWTLAANRRSTRLFEERDVPPEVVERIVQGALYAPTSCNRQLWHFIAVTDPEVKAEVSRLGDDGAQSYLYDAPLILAIFYDTTMESRNPCYTPYLTAGMAVYGVLLAAEAEGVGAIYLGGIRSPRGVAKAVGAPPHMQNLGLICLGYRADNPPAPNRRAPADVISYNHFPPTLPYCHPDIRPHVWKLRQLADFRDKVLWYKGVGFDAKTLHVNPDPRHSPKFQYMTERLGMMTARYAQPRVLDIFAHNGDLVLQLLNTCGPQLGTLYAYDLTEGIARYIRERLEPILPLDNVEFVVNAGVDQIQIPLPDNSVDVVSCYERLGHFEDPAPLAREMARVLRPGGSGLVVVSNRYYPHMYRYRRSWKKNYALGRNWDFGPERKFRPWDAERVLKEAGLRVVSMTGLGPVERKVASLAARWCRRLNWHTQGDRIEDWAEQRNAVRGLTRYCANALAFEVAKD